MKTTSRFIRISAIVLAAASLTAAQTYRNIAFNRGDVRAPGHGFPHASSNSEYNCNYDAAPNCVPDTTFLALSAINGDTLNTSHGSLTYASWGPQLTVPGLWWKVDFGHDVTVDKIKIWVRADWAGGHDSYWKRATLVFSEGTRDTIAIDSVKTGQTFSFSSRNTQSITITDLAAANPAKWCAFTEVQAWGYDPATEVISPAAKHQTEFFAAPTVFRILSGGTVHSIRVPDGTGRIELYSVMGKKIWARDCVNKERVEIPSSLAQGVLRVRYISDNY